MNRQYQEQALTELEQEAIAWLIKLDGDHQPELEDLDRLQEWMSRSPSHRRAMNKVNRFWSNTILTELIVPLDHPRHNAQARRERPRPGFFQSRAVIAGGAFLGLVAAVAVLLNLASPAPPVTELYTTSVGQQEVVTLADGSLAHLNTNTRLQVQYSEDARSLHLLQGQVHFNVSHNPSQPFRVYGGDGVVEAIGTAFTVSLLSRQMDILVTEGLVEVSAHSGPTKALDASGAPTNETSDLEFGSRDNRARLTDAGLKRLATLSAGQKMSIEQAMRTHSNRSDFQPASSIVTILSQKDVEQHESWRRGLLIFNGEPLFRVIEEISRFTEVAVEIADPELRDLEIGGRFKVGDVEAMLVSLEANFDIFIDRTGGDRIIIKAAK